MTQMKPKKYVFLTSDLLERTDYFSTQRFKYYKDCILADKSSKEQLSSENLDEEFPLENNDENDVNETFLEIHNLWSIQKSELYPALEHPHGNADELFNGRSKVKFALLSIIGETKLFRDVIRKRIPFVFVCPNGPKCEWLNIKSSKHLSEFVNCEERLKGCKNSECKLHKDFYNRDDIGKIIEAYKIGFSSIIGHKKVDKVPIFQLSTAIDILRWWHFCQEYLPKPDIEGLEDKIKPERLINSIEALIQKIEKIDIDKECFF